MKPLQILILCILVVPFIEIYVLLQVSGLIGAFPTILLVVSTAIMGSVLLKRQGLATWQRFQSSLAQGQIPAYEMIEGPILLVGGALLLTPGFFTDLLGFVCLIPVWRKKLAQYIIENHLLDAVSGQVFNSSKSWQKSDAIEGEYSKKD